jgi:hypothetical protein
MIQMEKRQHIDTPLPSLKTKHLFEQRHVSLLARSALDIDSYSHWLSTVTAIQDSIYCVDAYYESNRTLSFSDEWPLWELIRSEIRKSNGSASFSVWSDFSDLRRYGGVEARIHEFDLIDPREFGDIVRLKASDVRMARGLIWSYVGTPHRAVLEFWNTFDECGELIEDLADITEDGKDWNFNFWLYSFMAEGDVQRSHAITSATLRRKLAALEESYANLPSEQQDRCANVFKQTLTAGCLTLKNCGIVDNVVKTGRVIRFSEANNLLAVAS